MDRAFEKTLEKIFIPIRWAVTFAEISILWLLFSAKSISEWIQILLRILSMQDGHISTELIKTFEVSVNVFLIKILKILQIGNAHVQVVVLFIFMMFILCLLPENTYKRAEKLGIISLFTSIAVFVCGVLLLSSESIFVYYGF